MPKKKAYSSAMTKPAKPAYGGARKTKKKAKKR
jgi:hypothetical protein